MLDFQQRIDYRGEISEVVRLVCANYQLGTYQGHSVVPVGYEDLSLKLATSQGTFFVKIFASFRSLQDCRNYTEVIARILDAGVPHPKLKEFPGGVLWDQELRGVSVRLCVMDWIDGDSFYDLGVYPVPEEIAVIAQEAAKINAIDFKPPFIYDQWAVVNFPEELQKTLSDLTAWEKDTLEELLEEWSRLGIDSLPHALVHGDLTTTNVLKSKRGDLMFIDFAVANYYPRVVELTIMAVDLLFDPAHPELFMKNWDIALASYQNVLKLSEKELAVLPLFIKVAHAMHIIGGTREKMAGNTSEENEYWLNKGRAGLRFVLGVL